jgi:hypothetical protein
MSHEAFSFPAKPVKNVRAAYIEFLCPRYFEYDIYICNVLQEIHVYLSVQCDIFMILYAVKYL